MYPLSLVRTSIILSSTSSWFVTDLSNFYKYFFPFQSNFWWFFFSTPISFSFTFPSLLPIIFLFTSFPFPWCNLFDVVLFIASLRIRTSYCHFFRMRITILSPFPIWNWLKKNDVILSKVGQSISKRLSLAAGWLLQALNFIWQTIEPNSLVYLLTFYWQLPITWSKKTGTVFPTIHKVRSSLKILWMQNQQTIIKSQ